MPGRPYRINIDDREFFVDVLERSQLLKEEADYLIEALKIGTILESNDTVFLTGSYFLDTMIWPDLDINVENVELHQFMEIGKQIAESDLVLEMKYINFYKKNRAQIAVRALLGGEVNLWPLGHSMEDGYLVAGRGRDRGKPPPDE